MSLFDLGRAAACATSSLGVLASLEGFGEVSSWLKCPLPSPTPVNPPKAPLCPHA